MSQGSTRLAPPRPTAQSLTLVIIFFTLGSPLLSFLSHSSLFLTLKSHSHLAPLSLSNYLIVSLFQISHSSLLSFSNSSRLSLSNLSTSLTLTLKLSLSLVVSIINIVCHRCQNWLFLGRRRQWVDQGLPPTEAGSGIKKRRSSPGKGRKGFTPPSLPKQDSTLIFNIKMLKPTNFLFVL